MTVFAYHKGTLCTDSLISHDTGSINLFSFAEKVYKHPSGRWLLIKPGPKIDPEAMDHVILEDINAGLIEYYDQRLKFPNKLLLLKNIIPSAYASPFMTQGLLMTQKNVWFRSQNSAGVGHNDFVTGGAGQLTCSSFFGVFGNVKLAVTEAARWDFSCGGEIHTYLQKDLKPFPRIK